MHTILLLENLEGRGHLDDLDIDEKIIFELLLGK
jgi:hypothetical protein